MREDVVTVEEKHGKRDEKPLRRFASTSLADFLHEGLGELNVVIKDHQHAMAMKPQPATHIHDGALLNSTELDAGACQGTKRRSTTEESSSQPPRKRGRPRKTPLSQPPIPRSLDSGDRSMGDYAQSESGSQSSTRYSTPRQTRASASRSRDQSEDTEDIIAREPRPYDTYTPSAMRAAGYSIPAIHRNEVLAALSSHLAENIDQLAASTVKGRHQAPPFTNTARDPTVDHIPAMGKPTVPPVVRDPAIIVSSVQNITTVVQNSVVSGPEAVKDDFLGPSLNSKLEGPSNDQSAPEEQVDAENIENPDALGVSSAPTATPKKSHGGRPRATPRKKASHKSATENALEDTPETDGEVTYYSQYEVDRLEGAFGGVYIDPPEIKRPRLGRNKESSIVVFRLKILQDPEYLKEKAGKQTYMERLTERMSWGIVEVEDSTAAPSRIPKAMKRNYIAGFDKPSKKRKVTGEFTSTVASEGVSEQGTSMEAYHNQENQTTMTADAQIPTIHAQSQFVNPALASVQHPETQNIPRRHPAEIRSSSLQPAQQSLSVQQLPSGLTGAPPRGSMLEQILTSNNGNSTYESPFSQRPSYQSPWQPVIQQPVQPYSSIYGSPFAQNKDDSQHSTGLGHDPISTSLSNQQPSHTSYPSSTNVGQNSLYPSPTRLGQQTISPFT